MPGDASGDETGYQGEGEKRIRSNRQTRHGNAAKADTRIT